METFGPFAAGFMPDGNGICLMRTGGVSVWVGLAHEGEGGCGVGCICGTSTLGITLPFVSKVAITLPWGKGTSW